MKRISIFTAIILVTLGAASQAPSFAQKQRGKKPASATKSKPTPTPTPDMRSEAAQVAAQIKNVSNFIYVYGKVVNSLQIAEEQMKNDQVSPEAQARNQENKDKLITSMNKLRSGLENLASGFEGNQRMQVQYLKLAYATEASFDAERLAAAGRYEEAGRSLVAVVERLTDAIISMRLP
ncbi:MAG TPA: hypothetical protein VIM99_02495 [Blastocatellia bacterium]